MIRQDGFTIPEFLVSMVVLAIVLAGFGQVLINTSKTSNRVEEQAMLQNEVRSSIDRLTTDFRSATEVNGSPPVISVSPTTLTFDSPDRATPFHLRRISYRLNGTTLERSQIVSINTGSWPWTWPVTPGSWTQELGSIKNASVFSFLDGDGNTTTDPNLVRSVRVTLSVQAKQTQAATSTYTALVTIRSLQ
jgi:prepilin-type N-terminal cleavage/methylation domain-containing protein